jgi:hypothetical protein
MIRDGKYTEVVKVLNTELQSHPKSRAALSLLGYCYYYQQVPTYSLQSLAFSQIRDGCFFRTLLKRR